MRPFTFKGTTDTDLQPTQLLFNNYETITVFGKLLFVSSYGSLQTMNNLRTLTTDPTQLRSVAQHLITAAQPAQQL